MYEEVKSQNPSYEFIDFKGNPTLAHLTQLFPILENKIRSLGEIFGIVPVCESEDKCHRLKEPDSILKSIGVRFILSLKYSLPTDCRSSRNSQSWALRKILCKKESK